MPRTLTAFGPRSDASLSWIGLLTAMKPLLSTVLTTLTPIFSSFACASCSSLKGAVSREKGIFGHGGLHPHLDALEVRDRLHRLLAVHVPQALRAQPQHVRALHLGRI